MLELYFLIAVAAAGLVIVVYIEYPKTFSSTVCIFVVFYLWLEFYYLPQRVLSAVPSDFGVEKTLYRKEDLDGSGIAVFELPDETKDKIERYGLKYLDGANKKNSSRYTDDGLFENWGETPISINEAWTGPVMDGIPAYKTSIPQISNYLSRYNSGLNIDSQIELQINSVIQSRGSYFAYQNVRLIIVSPSERVIVYAYSR